MDESKIREIVRQELGLFIRSDRFTFQKDIQMLDGRNIQLSTGTGTKIGTATTQKIGFLNATPVARQAALTAKNTGTVDTTYGADERDVIENNRTRISELEDVLQAFGFLT